MARLSRLTVIVRWWRGIIVDEPVQCKSKIPWFSKFFQHFLSASTKSGKNTV